MAEKLSNKANACNNFLFKSQNYYLKCPKWRGLVPQNHFVRIVSKTVDELEIKEKYEKANTTFKRAQ